MTGAWWEGYPNRIECFMSSPGWVLELGARNRERDFLPRVSLPRNCDDMVALKVPGLYTFMGHTPHVARLPPSMCEPSLRWITQRQCRNLAKPSAVRLLPAAGAAISSPLFC